MCSKNVVFFVFFSWKTAERLFLDAMEKIKAIGNEVTADLFNENSINERRAATINLLVVNYLINRQLF